MKLHGLRRIAPLDQAKPEADENLVQTGLRNWLTKNAACAQDVIIATSNKTSREKHVSRDALRDVLGAIGWIAVRSYTRDGTLVGHVISPP